MPINKYQIINFIKSFFIHIFLMTVALTCIFPLFWMVRSALMTKETIFTDHSLFPKIIEFGNFSTAWIEGNFGTYFLNSVIYSPQMSVFICSFFAPNDSSIAIALFTNSNGPQRKYKEFSTLSIFSFNKLISIIPVRPCQLSPLSGRVIVTI